MKKFLLLKIFLLGYASQVVFGQSYLNDSEFLHEKITELLKYYCFTKYNQSNDEYYFSISSHKIEENMTNLTEEAIFEIRSLLKQSDNIGSSYLHNTKMTSKNVSNVVIENLSSYNIKLILENKTIMLPPYSTKVTFVNSGELYYTAQASGVISNSGYEHFEAFQNYKWELWVERKK
ncbi:MAG: hypothetical protein RMJ97_07400 [Raineya sp.]|nr:hypothetical protein [Raineya sp.]MDW8296696.1 hypothetical protein [Raineya sp.]